MKSSNGEDQEGREYSSTWGPLRKEVRLPQVGILQNKVTSYVAFQTVMEMP